MPITAPLRTRSSCWPDHLHPLFIIHNAYDPSAELRTGSPPSFAIIWPGVTMYSAAYELAAGRDYEVVPIDATAPTPFLGDVHEKT